MFARSGVKISWISATWPNAGQIRLQVRSIKITLVLRVVVERSGMLIPDTWTACWLIVPDCDFECKYPFPDPGRKCWNLLQILVHSACTIPQPLVTDTGTWFWIENVEFLVRILVFGQERCLQTLVCDTSTWPWLGPWYTVHSLSLVSGKRYSYLVPIDSVELSIYTLVGHAGTSRSGESLNYT